MPPGPLWRLSSPSKLLLRSWDDDEFGLVYDSVAGNTHLVEVLALDIFEVLGSTAISAAAIADKLAEHFSAEDREEIPAFVTSTLLQLRDIGLVVNSPA